MNKYIIQFLSHYKYEYIFIYKKYFHLHNKKHCNSPKKEQKNKNNKNNENNEYKEYNVNIVYNEYQTNKSI